MCATFGLSFITGTNHIGYSTGSSWDISHSSTIERILSGISFVLSGAFSYGLKKKKAYAWWIGSAGFLAIAIGLLGNLIHLRGEKELSRIAWGVFTQIVGVVFFAYLYLKLWKPLKQTTFSKIENTDPDAVGNG